MAKKVSTDVSKDIAVQSNALVRAIYALPAMDKKLILIAYSQVRKEDKELHEYIFDRQSIARALNREKDRNYDWLEQTCSHIFEHHLTFRIPDGGWEKTTWLSSAKYDPSKGTVSFVIQPRLKDYLLNLKNQFTVVPLDQALRLSGKYSIRILELLLQWKSLEKGGKWTVTFTVQELREMFELTDRYSSNKELRRRVIESAREEINEADIGLTLDVEPIKQGRSVTGFALRVQTYMRGAPRPIPKPSEEESEIEALGGEDRQRFMSILAELKSSQELLPLGGYISSFMRDQALQGEAFKRFQQERRKRRPTG